MVNNSYANNSLFIVTWNANGRKYYNNQILITLQKNRVSIALISETYFTDTSVLSFPGFILFHTNHPDPKPRS